ncbi:taste receptor type 2 member 134-like protein [Camelus ferus]|nr:taste receptor type 2 member 134-like protein [Camelus ferus]
MLPLPVLIFMAVFLLESLAAMLQNGFMVTVLSKEWVRCRTLPTGDMIVACLAASRFCLHGMALLNNFLSSFGFYTETKYFSIPWQFINSLTFWLTAWLALFYCVKISFFSHRIFFWLKWRVSRSVPRLLLGSLVLSGLAAVSSVIRNMILTRRTETQSSQGNNTLASRLQTVSSYIFLSHMILMWLIPFLLFLVSILLLMFSLCRHLRQMTDHRPGPSDPSTQAHTVALKSLAFFLIFYTSYFLSLVIAVSNIKALQSHWHWAWEVVIYAGICLHSSILVLSSPKLRKVLKKRLWRALGEEQFVSSYQYQ